MTMRKILWTIIIGSCLIAADIVIDGWFPKGLIVNEAQARIGRPLTPLSVAGVARRTTRRRIRRTTIYVATLPKGCTTVKIDGATCYKCGGTYYQAHNGQYVVVHVE